MYSSFFDEKWHPGSPLILEWNYKGKEIFLFYLPVNENILLYNDGEKIKIMDLNAAVSGISGYAYPELKNVLLRVTRARNYTQRDKRISFTTEITEAKKHLYYEKNK